MNCIRPDRWQGRLMEIPAEWITRHGLPVLSIQGLVDFIKQVEGRRVALLNGKDEGESHQGFLSSWQLLHLSHLTLLPREGHLQRGPRDKRWAVHYDSRFLRTEFLSKASYKGISRKMYCSQTMGLTHFYEPIKAQQSADGDCKWEIWRLTFQIHEKKCIQETKWLWQT